VSSTCDSVVSIIVPISPLISVTRLWSVGEVTRMDSMFNGASQFNRDLSSWNGEFLY
jgi:hypothetical protein